MAYFLKIAHCESQTFGNGKQNFGKELSTYHGCFICKNQKQSQVFLFHKVEVIATIVNEWGIICPWSSQMIR